MSVQPSHLDLVVLADHNQFYVCDQGPPADAQGAADEMLWVGAAAENRLDVRPGEIAVLTKTDGYVRVRIEVSQEPPKNDVARHDHAVEASLESPSGTLIVISETAEVGTLTVAPDTYRVRVIWDGLDVAPDVNLDRENPPESVRLHFWPAPAAQPRVLKWYWEWQPKPPEKRPKSPYRLRVLFGESEIELALPERRAVGSRVEADGSITGLIQDAEGNYWEEVTSEEPPYERQLFEIPVSEIRRFRFF